MGYAVLDTTDSVLGIDVKGVGYSAVIKYAAATADFPNKTWTAAEIAHLHGQGVGVGMIYERFASIEEFENPGVGGAAHAGVIVTQAKKLGFPAGKGTGLGWACDFDATKAQILGPIKAYAASFRQVVKAAGFLSEGYISGLGLSLLGPDGGGLGLIHYKWLPQATGWANYATYLAAGKWDIHQLLNSPMKLSADGDNANNLDWSWLK